MGLAHWDCSDFWDWGAIKPRGHGCTAFVGRWFVPAGINYLEQSKSTRHSGEASTLGNGAEEQVGKPLSL